MHSQVIANGNLSAGPALMDAFRAAAESVGECLHLNHMTSNDAELVRQRRVDSRTDYGWMKYGKGPGYVFPHTDYDLVADYAMSQLQQRTQHYASVYGLPYVPIISVAWDSSPRTLPQDGWGEFGYPWGISVRVTEARARRASLFMKPHTTHTRNLPRKNAHLVPCAVAKQLDSVDSRAGASQSLHGATLRRRGRRRGLLVSSAVSSGHVAHFCVGL